ncbi:MAG TPA: prolipoprotein diacylglyceryl transferase, partial [Verrucomicrobiales bacterium]|nr:prolipoprotein diacylglyceryl transferase [Verrucomicrobiales bacterium]
MSASEGMQVLGVWVHNLKPELVELSETFALRWYGLAYLAGFIAGYYGLRWLAQKRLWVVGPEKVADFIAYAALFGVFLGGRLGYVAFYMIPENGWGYVLGNPLVIFQVWNGGMSSHGGILGLTIFTYFYARRANSSWTGVGDGLVIFAPLGIFFGRIANFINGELYGRVTSAPTGMKFPKELLGREEDFHAAMKDAVSVDPEQLDGLWNNYLSSPATGQGQLLEGVLESGRSNSAIIDAIAGYMQIRHPSQLYQALLEGFSLFAILLLLRLRFPHIGHGIITGAFFMLYATFRIIAEHFRE